MARHIQQNDTVQVITGKDSGKQGKVIRVIPGKSQVVVQGLNLVRKHLRPSQKNPQGGVIDKEMPIHFSNIQPVVDGKPTRVRFMTNKDGSKVRVAVKGGAVLGRELRKAR